MSDLLVAVVDCEAHRVAGDRQLLLHCRPEDAQAVANAIGLVLGDVLLSSVDTASWSALHLSPDEWLLIGPAGDGAHLAAAVADAARPASLVDVSDRTLAIDLRGAGAAAWLAGGCPLDIALYADGACTRTLFGKATVMLWRRGDGWRLSYARSFDDYVTTLLRAVAVDLVSEGSTIV